MKKTLYSIWEIAEVFIIALIAVAIVKYFLIQPFIVNGASMEPNFYNGDYLLIDELSYRFREPERGDVIVFHSPQDYSIYYIKRIIGLPGETVEVKNNQVTVYNDQDKKGFVLKEDYLPSNLTWAPKDTALPIKIDTGQYFVLGDNRLNSMDSRYWGTLKQDAIVGLVKIRLWPVTEAKIFKELNYQLQ